MSVPGFVAFFLLLLLFDWTPDLWHGVTHTQGGPFPLSCCLVRVSWKEEEATRIWPLGQETHQVL